MKLFKKIVRKVNKINDKIKKLPLIIKIFNNFLGLIISIGIIHIVLLEPKNLEGYLIITKQSIKISSSLTLLLFIIAFIIVLLSFIFKKKKY
jgi:hypothetical protein